MSPNTHGPECTTDGAPACGPHTSGRLRILVVDDSAAMRAFMKARIEAAAQDGLAVSVEAAASGEEAVSRCAGGEFDLVFMDVVMPGMGGLAACRAIKASHKTRVAMVSSLKGQEDHDAAREAGCDNYLGKPVQEGDIKAVLRIVSLRKLTEAPAALQPVS